MSLRDTLGCNDHLAADPLLWAAAATLGGGVARIDGNWNTVQETPDQWHWDPIDRAVSGARAVGLEPYVSLAHTPQWANGYPTVAEARGKPPTSIMDWTTFVEAIGQRYQGQVTYWGVGNEYQGPVTEYLEYFYYPAYHTLKGITTTNQVCGPDLATVGDWPAWLQGFLHRAGDLCDVITIHCYEGSGTKVWNKLTKPRRLWEFWKEPSIRQVIEQAGYGAKNCWVTETGWDSFKVGEDTQARYLDQLLERWQGTSWPNGILVFALCDEPDNGWGLVRQDFSIKPAGAVLQRYAARETV
jgi:hypothetical protein